MKTLHTRKLNTLNKLTWDLFTNLSRLKFYQQVKDVDEKTRRRRIDEFGSLADDFTPTLSQRANCGSNSSYHAIYWIPRKPQMLASIAKTGVKILLQGIFSHSNNSLVISAFSKDCCVFVRDIVQKCISELEKFAQNIGIILSEWNGEGLGRKYIFCFSSDERKVERDTALLFVFKLYRASAKC
jgi:hypothetical protein